MASDNEDDRNYHAEAAKDQYNLILMVFFFLSALVAWNPAPALIGAGLEMLYLLFVPETEFFKRYVKNKYFNRRAQEAAEERKRRIQNLSHHQRRRYKKIDAIINSTKENLDEASEGLGGSMVGKLDRLRERYLWMMELVNDYEGYLNSLQRGKIRSDMDDVEHQLKSAEGQVEAALQERLGILKKRFDRLEKVRQNHTIVKTQIQTVEDILRLIYESSMTMQNPQGISQQIDDLMFEVESTEETVMELDQIGGEEQTLANFDEKLEQAREKQKQAARAQT